MDIKIPMSFLFRFHYFQYNESVLLACLPHRSTKAFSLLLTMCNKFV